MRRESKGRSLAQQLCKAFGGFPGGEVPTWQWVQLPTGGSLDRTGDSGGVPWVIFAPDEMHITLAESLSQVVGWAHGQGDATHTGGPVRAVVTKCFEQRFGLFGHTSVGQKVAAPVFLVEPAVQQGGGGLANEPPIGSQGGP